MSLQNLLDKVVILRPSLFRIFEVTLSEKRYQDEQEYLNFYQEAEARVEARSFDDAIKVDAELQRRFLKDGRHVFDHYDCYLAYNFGNAGVLYTIQKMHSHQHNINKVKAILLAACLYENKLECKFKDLYHDLKQFVGDEGWWSRPWRYTLPNIYGIYLDDVDRRDRSISDELIIERICNYLTRLVAHTDFIEIQTTPHQTAFLKRMIDDEQLDKINRKIKHYRYLEETKEERAKKEAEHKKYVERQKQLKAWRSVTDSDLERMVWTHSGVAISEMYGVTETAVRKRCTSAGIERPDVGFWSKVKSGIIPHPNGKKPKWFKQTKKVIKKKVA